MARLPGYSLGRGAELESLHERARGATPAMAELDTWELLGPGNIGGRTRALVIHPRRSRIRYAGGVSGGLWKTEDGGQSWRPLADLLPNIAISALAMDPSDPDVLYAGTGEGHFREVVRETSLPLRGAGTRRAAGPSCWSDAGSGRSAAAPRCKAWPERTRASTSRR